MSINSIIYGPVPSWRLGRSLGIDLLSTEGKTCSFDCVYCQLGRTVHPIYERREFVTIDHLAYELEKVKGIGADYITFSGVGEPTLALNLGEAIELARAYLGLPVAVLTNSSLMTRDDVRHDLSLADVVVAKVDAHTNELFHKINHPVKICVLEEILLGIELLNKQYRGKLAIQMMFMEMNKSYAQDMASIAENLLADEVQINTPLRPCPVRPLRRQEIEEIQKSFFGLKSVISVYKTPRPEVFPQNLEETLRRRPKLYT